MRENVNTTAGTYLNRKPLPKLQKKKNGELKGRVLLVHGDEILLKSPEAERLAEDRADDEESDSGDEDE